MKRGQTFMMFGYDYGIMGDLVTDWPDQNVVPFYKGTWADIRQVGGIADCQETASFKTRRYVWLK